MKEGGTYSMQQWGPMMVWKYTDLSELFHLKRWIKFVIQMELDCIGIKVYQFLETKNRSQLDKTKKYDLEIATESNVKL